mgnify:FL=1
MRRFPRRAFVALAWTIFGFLSSALHSAPAEAAFIAALSADDQAAAGLPKLTASERAELDRQIAREITLARQGDVIAFAKPFGDRRTSAQITATGLSRLSAGERTELDALVARAVARRPVTAFTRYSKKSADDDAVETVTYRPQLHGQISLTYGTAGRGREFYGGSSTTIYDDPAHGFAAAFTYAEYHGKGLSPFDGCGPLSPGRMGFRPDW